MSAPAPSQGLEPFADEGFRQSAALFRVAFEHAPIGVAIADAEYNWIRVNEALCKLTGYSEEELLRLGFRGVTHPDDLPANLRHVQTLERGPAPSVQFEKRYVHRSGRVLHVLVSLASVRDAAGAICGVVALIHDITARAAAEEALRTSGRRFQTLAELAPVGIFQTNPVGGCTYVNQRLCEMTERPPAAFMGDRWMESVHPEERERIKAEWNAATETGAEYRGQYRVQTQTGAVRWLVVSARPIRGQDGAVESFLGTVTDVTQIKEAETRLRESLSVQAAVIARETTLLRELSHRVRNNLAGLMGLLAIYERSDKSGAEVAAAMRGKLRAMSDAHDLITRAPGAPILLSDLTTQLAAGVRQGIDAEGPPVRVPAAQAAPLAMIVQELLTNSAKHGALSTAGGRVAVRWDVVDNGAVTVTWSESGGPSIREPERTGVGLSLVKGFAEGDLGGACRFEFHSAGFRCILRLPVQSPNVPVDYALEKQQR